MEKDISVIADNPTTRKHGILEEEELNAMMVYLKETIDHQFQAAQQIDLDKIPEDTLELFNVHAAHLTTCEQILGRLLEHLLQQTKNKKLN